MTPKPKSLYGQYCPLSMACELLCNRWTMLVIRELLDGSTAFNQIGRGVPAMSRNLLSQRLKELEAAGILSCRSARRGAQGNYRLTPAGEALGAVVMSMATWGQEWIDVEPSVDQIDASFLMWDMRRNVKPLPDLPSRFTVHFHYPDAEETLKEHWLVFENNEVELCHFDPGHQIDVEIEADLRTMTMVWMGWEDFAKAQREGRLQIRGDRKFVTRAREWLGLSKLAGIPKQSEAQRVLRQWSRSPDARAESEREASLASHGK
jgi:DNA-binding HxlR family transcriptional regulator